MSDWSERSDEEIEVVEENEDREDYEADTESESDRDELDYDVEIEGDESDYIDECPVNISHFDLIQKLGTGAYGTVFLVKKNCGIDVDQIYALKVISKSEVVKVPKTIIHMKAERKALEILRHCPYIQKLYYAFQTGDKLFLVTDYMPGGEMFTLLQKGALPEHQVRFYMAELVVALEHIHQHGIVYRDIKLENVLIDADGHIKLVDFGLCKKLGPRGRSKSFCGTEEYMAPEVIACTGHNTAADWWALGVLAIELLTTVTPFGVNEVPNAIMTRITNDDPIMPQNISEAMEDFITKILAKDPEERLGGSSLDAEAIKQHRLFKDIDWGKLEHKLLPSPAVPTIRHLYDTQNFSEDFTQQPASYEPSEVPRKSFLTFKGYSYIAPELSPTQSNHHDADSSIDENWNTLTRDIFSNRDADSEFYRKYRFASQQPLGNGESSVCMKCFDLSDDTTAYAVKIYKRQDQKKNEINVLQKAAARRLPGVLHLVEVLTDSKWTYLIMELVDEGVNLLEYFSTVPLKRNSTQVFNAFNALWKIVKSVHSLKYAHGRICFKNVWYMKRTKEFRLIGFSNAKPINQAADEQIDYWSLGVCIYTVLCGHPPFDVLTSNLPEMTKRIANNDFDQDSEQWIALHKDIKCFVDQLLCCSIPTCSPGQLKIITKSSVQAVNCSKEQIDGNEKIVAIRAAKVHKQSSDWKAVVNATCNGMEVATNGKASVLMTANDHHSKILESHRNHTETNGYVAKAEKRNHRQSISKEPLIKSEVSKYVLQTAVTKEPLGNKYKKPKLHNHETLIKPEDIKQERGLRKKERVNYAQRVNFYVRASKPTVSRTDAENIKIKEEKIAPSRKAKKTQPNGKANKTETKPRKAVKNQSEPVKLKPTRKATAKFPAEHSRPPTRPVTQKNTVDTRPQFTDQRVQTDRVHILTASYPKPKKIPYYCFERFDYK